MKKRIEDLTVIGNRKLAEGFFVIGFFLRGFNGD